MEVLQYRDNGELSDVTVKIGEDEFKLHKFPLYIKSDFFKETAQDKDTVEIEEFPGGKNIFSLVADFCYGKPIDFTLGNIAALRNAAELLVMKGSGNLTTVTEKYIEDILASAKLSRSIAPIMEILIQCDALGEEADKAKVGFQCFNAIVEIWLREPQSSRFTPHQSRTMPGSMSGYSCSYDDSSITDRLVNIPLTWLLELIKSCGDHEGKLKLLAEVVYKYLAKVFTEADRLGKGKLKKTTKKVSADEDEDEKPAEDAGGVSDAEEDGEKKKGKGSSPGIAPGETLDAVIMAIPEETPLADLITIDWIKRALEISEAYNCECRERLLQLAGNVLHRFSSEELKQIPSATLCEIIDNTVRNEKVVPEVLTCVLDSYMCELAKKKGLEVDDFIKLVKCVPENYRINHDTLFDVLEHLLTSGEDIPDEKKKELLETVDLSRCHEDTLQRALDKNLVPARDLCQAAINLAARIRQEKEDPPRTPKYTDDLTYRSTGRAAFPGVSLPRPIPNYLSSYDYDSPARHEGLCTYHHTQVHQPMSPNAAWNREFVTRAPTVTVDIPNVSPFRAHSPWSESPPPTRAGLETPPLCRPCPLADRFGTDPNRFEITDRFGISDRFGTPTNKLFSPPDNFGTQPDIVGSPPARYETSSHRFATSPLPSCPFLTERILNTPPLRDCHQPPPSRMASNPFRAGDPNSITGNNFDSLMNRIRQSRDLVNQVRQITDRCYHSSF